MATRKKEFEIPRHLLDEIRKGQCVAFIGAGFSMAAHLPSWGALLNNVLNAEVTLSYFKDHETQKDLPVYLKQLVAEGGADNFEMVAQILEDELGNERVSLLLAESLQLRPPLPQEMVERLKILKGIPFKTVLTTNFDEILLGEVPSMNPNYDAILRCRKDVKTAFSCDPNIKSKGAGLEDADPTFPWPVIKIHGCIRHPKSMVWTKSGYRKLINEVPGYMNFLRTLLATSTVLYIGFSFSDGYLNELRGEVLSMLYSSMSDPELEDHANKTEMAKACQRLDNRKMVNPLGYAIINDKIPAQVDFFLKHEGVQIMSWNTHADGGYRDWSGLDKYLLNIYKQTSRDYYLGRLTVGHRILVLARVYFDDVRAEDVKDNSNPEGLVVCGASTEASGAASSGLTSPATSTHKSHHGRTIKERKQKDAYLSKEEKVFLLLQSTLQQYYETEEDNGDLRVEEGGAEALDQASKTYIHTKPELSSMVHILYDDAAAAVDCLSKTDYDLVVCVYGWRSPNIETGERTQPMLEEFVNGMRRLPFSQQVPFIVSTSLEGIDEKRRMALNIGSADIVSSYTELVDAVCRLLSKMKMKL